MIIGIGSDLVDCRRLIRILDLYQERFLTKVFTPLERRGVLQKHNLASACGKLYAAKEAVLKALGTGLASGVCWHDIEISRTGNTPPQVQLQGRALEIAQAHGAEIKMHLSITDEWPYAQAFAILEAENN